MVENGFNGVCRDFVEFCSALSVSGKVDLHGIIVAWDLGVGRVVKVMCCNIRTDPIGDGDRWRCTRTNNRKVRFSSALFQASGNILVKNG